MLTNKYIFIKSRLESFESIQYLRRYPSFLGANVVAEQELLLEFVLFCFVFVVGRG